MSTPGTTREQKASDLWRVGAEVRAAYLRGHEATALARSRPVRDALDSADPAIRRLARRICEGWLALPEPEDRRT